MTLPLLPKLLVLSLFMQFALTVAIAVLMARARFIAGRMGQVDRARMAVDSSAWPDEVRKVQNNYVNQFELPVAFYVVGLLFLITEPVDIIAVILAFGFVGSRIVHAVVHVTRNYVPIRGTVFLLGFFFLIALWLWLGVKLFM